MMHGIIFIWGFTGVLGKALQDLSSATIVFYRMLIGFVVIGLFLIFSGKGLIISKKMLFKTTGIGLLIAAHWITFFQSIHLSNVSFALIFFSTAALFTSFLEPLLMKKKFAPSELIMGIVVVLGISIIAYDSLATDRPDLGANTNYPLAIVYAITSAFLASTFSILNAILVKDGDAVKITFFELMTGCIFIGVIYGSLGLLNAETLTINGYQFGLLAILGVICTGFAFYVGVWLMRHITPFTMNLSVNMEPIYAIIIALIWFRGSEVMSKWFYLGAAVVIGAVFFNAWWKGKKKKILPQS